MADLLVVENDPALRMGMLDFLSIEGYAVRSADCGLAALDLIEAKRPDLIISDMRMPGMTGLQLLEAVRLRPDWHSLPFLILSASISPHIESQLAARHAVSFLPKPFEIEMLIEAVAQATMLRPSPVGPPVSV